LWGFCGLKPKALNINQIVVRPVRHTGLLLNIPESWLVMNDQIGHKVYTSWTLARHVPYDFLIDSAKNGRARGIEHLDAHAVAKLQVRRLHLAQRQLF
jgi:hypothetical protein